MGSGAAAERITVGEQTSKLSGSSAALVAGEIGFPHLALIAHSLRALADSEARLESLSRLQRSYAGAFAGVALPVGAACRAPALAAASDATSSKVLTIDVYRFRVIALLLLS